MKIQPNKLTPQAMRGLASSSDVLHVSHLMDEFCDVLSRPIYKESVVVLQPSFVRNLPAPVWGANSSPEEKGYEMDELAEIEAHWDSVEADFGSPFSWLPEGGHEPF